MTEQEKAVSVCVEYFYAWDRCRAIRARIRALKCEFKNSETPPCHRDDRMLEADWCQNCVEGKRIIEEETATAKKLARLKLAAVARCGRTITRKAIT
jgi:hypothetical protein